MATGSGATGVVAYDNGTANNQRIGMFADSTANLVGFDNNYSSTTNGMVWRINAGEKMRLDANGNLGFRTTPSAWGTLSAIEGTGGALVFNSTVSAYLAQNIYYNGSAWIYKNSAAASLYIQNSGQHQFCSIASGTAGSSATITANVTVDNNGNLLVGTGTATSNAAGRGLIEINGSTNSLLALDVGGSRQGYLYHSGTDMQLVNQSATGQIQFSTNGAVRLSVSSAGVIADTAGNELGWKDVPANSQTSAYTLVIGDRGKQVLITTGGVTVPQSVFSVGNIVTIVNNSGTAQTITQGTGVTMHQAGTANTGNRTLAAWGIASVLCVGSSVFVISGNVS